MADTERLTVRMDREPSPGATGTERLLVGDTQSLVILLLVAVLLATTLGCSAKVEVERATTEEKNRTAIHLDLLQSRPTKPRPTSPATTTIINVGSGNVHVGEAPTQAQPARPRNGLNTVIGFPSTYLAHGPLAFLGYMADCLLVGTAVVLMMGTVGRKTGGPLLPTILLLVAAAILLQALPQAEAGFQLIPPLPWQCSGLLPTLASIICWTSLLLAVLIAITGCLDAPAIFSGLVLAVMGLDLLTSFGSGSEGTEVASVSWTTVEKKATAPVVPPQIRPPEPVATPRPPEPPKPVVVEVKPPTISNNTFVLNYRAGDIHTETHIHVHEPPKVQERITIHREVEPKPPRRPMDDPCDRGQREHEERVRRWRQFPKGY